MRENKKKVYEPPKLFDFGNISSVTSQQGMTFDTDTDFNGSMEFAGMSGEAMDMDMGM